MALKGTIEKKESKKSGATTRGGKSLILASLPLPRKE